MAKVTGPLMSMSASGTLGDTITFDKRGFVRNRVIPANPQTEAQGIARQKLLAIQKALSVLGATPIAAVKAVSPTSYRWNSFLLSRCIGSGSTFFDALSGNFDALQAGERATWEAAAGAASIFDQTIPYSGEMSTTAGKTLFIISAALFDLGINVVDGAPAETNASDWGTFFAS